MEVTPGFWRGRRVLVTGHTGFKGAWLSSVLARSGAVVGGYSLEPPTRPNLFEEARLAELVEDRRGDVRSGEDLARAFREFRPEAVVHLAAQSLVRRSYVAPDDTFSTNVLGTVRVLDAARGVAGLRGILVVTSDKCYENRETGRAFREEDPLGGKDPYSASKAAAEIVTASYRESFFGSGAALVASARAGNVIGGGDFAEDRLLPDLIRAFSRGISAELRNPHSTRPFQHVLDPIVGYLTLLERLCSGDVSFARAFNFGPEPGDVRSVAQVAAVAAHAWGKGADFRTIGGEHPPEAKLLSLDPRLSKELLDYSMRFSPEEAVERTVRFHKDLELGADARDLMDRDWAAYAAGAFGEPS